MLTLVSQPLLLASTEVDPLLPDLRVVPGGQQGEVRAEGGGLQDLLVETWPVLATKENVLLHPHVLDPGGLTDEGQAPAVGPGVCLGHSL